MLYCRQDTNNEMVGKLPVHVCVGLFDMCHKLHLNQCNCNLAVTFLSISVWVDKIEEISLPSLCA